MFDGRRDHPVKTPICLCLLALSVSSLTLSAMAAPADSPCAEIAEKRSEGLARQERAARHDKDPKRVRYVAPKFPHEWPKNCVGSPTGASVTAHEVLVGASGKVEQVWTLKSPCAEIDRVVVAAIKQWQYEPLVVDGTAVSYCATVTVNVHLR